MGPQEKYDQNRFSSLNIHHCCRNELHVIFSVPETPCSPFHPVPLHTPFPLPFPNPCSISTWPTPAHPSKPNTNIFSSEIYYFLNGIRDSLLCDSRYKILHFIHLITVLTLITLNCKKQWGEKITRALVSEIRDCISQLLHLQTVSLSELSNLPHPSCNSIYKMGPITPAIEYSCEDHMRLANKAPSARSDS